MQVLKALSYLRGFLHMFATFFLTLVFSVLTLIVTLVFRKVEEAYEMDQHYWARPLVRWAGVDVEVRGLENIPATGFLYLFNHTSYSDIMVMFGFLPRVPRFGAKEELFRIPFFGKAMSALGVLPIARQKRNQVLEIYKQAEERVARGECFALAPEGTRQTGLRLGKFKKGPFLFAVNAKMPVIPLVIAGAREVQPKGAFMMNTGEWRRKIIMEALPPLMGATYSLEQLDKFQQDVRERMEVKYTELNKELGLI